MPISVRLDPETEALLDRLTRTRQRTRSDILREALHRLAADSSKSVETDGPYEVVADLLGAAEDGPADLAANHKQAFRQLLSNKKPGK